MFDNEVAAFGKAPKSAWLSQYIARDSMCPPDGGCGISPYFVAVCLVRLLSDFRRASGRFFAGVNCARGGFSHSGVWA